MRILPPLIALAASLLTPLEKLDRRLASAEITGEEYRERRELLGGSTRRGARS